jgi:hypothetical protein
MTTFPSVEFFQEMADRLNNSDSFHRLGSCDTQMGIQVEDKFFEIDFEGFEVTEITEIDEARVAQLDFTLVQSLDDWKAMLADIKANGQATHEFTLNSLDLRSEVEFARGENYHERDKFYRFNQTFQEFFDNTAKMDYTYAEPVTA